MAKNGRQRPSKPCRRTVLQSAFAPRTTVFPIPPFSGLPSPMDQPLPSSPLSLPVASPSHRWHEPGASVWRRCDPILTPNLPNCGLAIASQARRRYFSRKSRDNGVNFGRSAQSAPARHTAIIKTLSPLHLPRRLFYARNPIPKGTSF